MSKKPINQVKHAATCQCVDCKPNRGQTNNKPNLGKVGKGCHSGNCEVLRQDSTGIVLMGGGQSRNAHPWGEDVDLLINLLGKAEKNVAMSNVPSHFQILEDMANPAVIAVNWSDGGVPHFSEAWWGELANAIRHEAEQIEGEYRVMAMCQGGHGRTGTTLAILAAKLGMLSEHSDPVRAIRVNYCDKAVEGMSQIDYVAEITGHKITAKPADPFGGIGYGTGFGGVYGASLGSAPESSIRGKSPESSIGGKSGSSYADAEYLSGDDPNLPFEGKADCDYYIDWWTGTVVEISREDNRMIGYYPEVL